METKHRSLGLSQDIAHHLNRQRFFEGRDLNEVDNVDLRSWIADNPQQIGRIIGYGVSCLTEITPGTQIHALDALVNCTYKLYRYDQLRLPILHGGFKDGLILQEPRLRYQLNRFLKAKDYLSEAEIVQ